MGNAEVCAPSRVSSWLGHGFGCWIMGWKPRGCDVGHPREGGCVRRGGMQWPGLRRQRGVHPAPNLSDPRCFPSVQSSGRCHRAHGRGCGAAGGSLLASGVTPASSQHACPQGLAAHPQDARGAGPGRWQQEGQPWCTHLPRAGAPWAWGPRFTRVSGAQASPVLCRTGVGQGPAAILHRGGEGSPLPGSSARGAAGVGVGQPGRLWGWEELLVQRRRRGRAGRLWSCCSVPQGSLHSPSSSWAPQAFSKRPGPGLQRGLAH